MAKKYGFFEFSFANDSILTGTYGNDPISGEVFPEMAKKKKGEKPGIAGRYDTFWLEQERDKPSHAEMLIEQEAQNPLAFKVYWGPKHSPIFTGFGNLLAPDRFVGYYYWD